MRLVILHKTIMIQSVIRMFLVKNHKLLDIYRVRKLLIKHDLPKAFCLPSNYSKHKVFKDGGYLYKEMVREMLHET